MRQLHNPKLIREAIESLSLQDIFSNDYSDKFLLFEYDKNEFIIREGFTQPYLFFIISGDVRCFSYHQSGRTSFMTYLRPKESSGLVGSFWGKPAVTNNQAVGKCRLLALPLGSLRNELLDDNKFLRYLSFELGKLLDQSNRFRQVTIQTSVESRIASLLLSSAKDDVARINISAAAESACTSYRHVLRVLQKMISDGALEKDGKNYIIKDIDYLTILSEDSYEYINDDHFSLQ